MKRILFISAIFLVITSCSETTKEAKEENEETKVEKMDAPEVQLNEGQLWEANMATIEGIKNLSVMVESFDSSSENYETLQSNLRDEFGLIFKNCTMKGEAHEQLHNYLLPLMELFGELTGEASEKTLGKIKEHLARFDSYFVMDV
jgi:flavorubredoxin